MYAYVKVIIERPNVHGAAARRPRIQRRPDLLLALRGGKAVRTELETGVSDEHWIEVTNRRPPVDRRVAQRLGPLDADRRHGTGDPGRPVSPHRRRAGRASPRRRAETKRRERHAALADAGSVGSDAADQETGDRT